MTAGELAAHPDPRVKPGVCGITVKTGAVEWVCIARPHDTEHQRSRQPSALGYAAKSERHYFVNRYPGRGE